MPLSQFARERYRVEVAVPGLAATTFFVSGEPEARALVAGGVRRGLIWTAAELRVVAAWPEADGEELLTLARVKARFDGVVVDVREAS